ncbi:MAG: ComF family protein [bacterium]|nr:ComF family protein [bacterium]
MSTIFGRLADLLWPRVCAIESCNRTSDRDGRHVCSRCLATFPFHEGGGSCRVCGGLVTADVRHDFTCETCQTEPPAYEFARSAVLYGEPVDRLIQDFKFRKATWLCEDLVDLLEGAVRAKLDFPSIDVVVPVPLHPKRERERGYNQSALLAVALAKRLKRRFDHRALIRPRDTEHQARLSGDDRKNNLRDAFAVAEPQWIRGRTILLVDDVMTTGSTLSHCARPLLKAGASRVWCATVARSVLRS